jgi:hypothetical protein
MKNFEQVFLLRPVQAVGKIVARVGTIFCFNLSTKDARKTGCFFELGMLSNAYSGSGLNK